ncbi:hypothetical protein PG984_007198 [Apiospora sp. TS-2023a]
MPAPQKELPPPPQDPDSTDLKEADPDYHHPSTPYICTREKRENMHSFIVNHGMKREDAGLYESSTAWIKSCPHGTQQRCHKRHQVDAGDSNTFCCQTRTSPTLAVQVQNISTRSYESIDYLRRWERADKNGEPMPD